MDTAYQWQQFCVCILQGVVGGIIYEICSLPFLAKGKCKIYQLFRLVADVLFFALFALFCVYVGNRLGLPSIREYYFLGYAAGAVLYSKTFHKAVAFFKKICYNCIRKLVNCLKSRKNFRKKEEKRV